MRGRIIKVHPTHYEVRCDELNETVILHCADVRPLGLNKNLAEQFTNSNGKQWGEGSSVDFKLVDWRINGRFVAENVSVSFVGR
jgi:hypothetical protein